MSSSQIIFFNGFGVDPCVAIPLKEKLTESMDDRYHRIETVTSLSRAFSDPEFEGNREAIQKLVIGGASVFGVCAGSVALSRDAYFKGAARYATHDGTPVGDRNYFRAPSDLSGVFPGRALAPLFVHGREKPNFNAIRLPIVQQKDGQTLEVANLYGGAFLDVDRIPGVEILARYTDLPADIQAEKTHKGEPLAIVPDRLAETILYTPRNAQGRFLLTHNHLEIDAHSVKTDLFRKTFRLTDDEQSTLADQLQVHDQARRALLESHFATLGIKTIPKS